MEIRAPFVIVGAFVLAAIAAVFGFVYWLQNTGSLGPRTDYQVQFDGSVPGLLVGAGVLFNGIRVGEVTRLTLVPEDARRVDATISVATATPVRSDTKVGLEFQGLTGVPVIALEGGKLLSETTRVTTLIAEPGAGQSMTQAARDALRRVDTVLAENAEPLKTTIANLNIFAESLARNSGKLDGIIAGIEKMTGGGPAAAPKVTYDLRAAQGFPAPGKTLRGQWVIPDPTTVVSLDTQRIVLSPASDVPGFADAKWADNIPKLLQARLIQSFENYDIAHAPSRPSDGLEADHQLLIDIRSFQVSTAPEPSADIEISARILDKEGKIVAAQIFRGSQKLTALEPAAAVTAFDGAFATVAKDLIFWTVNSL